MLTKSYLILPKDKSMIKQAIQAKAMQQIMPIRMITSASRIYLIISKDSTKEANASTMTIFKMSLRIYLGQDSIHANLRIKRNRIRLAQ